MQPDQFLSRNSFLTQAPAGMRVKLSLFAGALKARSSKAQGGGCFAAETLGLK
jgi:hypothetical protein